MVFLRAKCGAKEDTGGGQVVQGTIPKSVRAGDYCTLWIGTSTHTTVLTMPSWLSQVKTVTVPTTARFELWTGFVPSPVPEILSIQNSDTTKACVWSASFWGGVDPANPYSFPAASTGPAGATYTTTVTSLAGSDDFSGLGVGVTIGGTAADVGGNWTTAGAATDFAGTNFLGLPTNHAGRSTSSEAAPRFAALPNASTITDTRVQVYHFQNLPLPSGTGNIRSGCVARYVDTSNYVAGYHEFVSWTFSAGPPYNKVSQESRYVVEVVVGGISTKYTATGYDLPSSWPYSSMNVNLTTELSVTREGVIKYGRAGYTPVIEVTDQVAALTSTLAAGRAGMYDMNSSGTGYQRVYASCTVNGTANNFPAVSVVAGFLTNAETMQMASTPNSPVNIDERIGDALGSNIGRALTQRYFALPATTDQTITVTANNESGTAASDTISIGSVVLNSDDPAYYGQTTRAINLRSTGPGQAGWEFYLADGQDMTHIARLRARDRNLTWVLNRPGSASCKIKMTDAAAKRVEPWATSLVAYKDGEVKWSGLVLTVDEDTSGSWMSISAVGWLQLLERRLLSPNDERFARFGSTDAGIIASHLIALSTSAKEFPFYVGHVQGTQFRKRYYQRFQNIGQEITSLSDIESGYDIWIDPATRELQIWNRLEEDRSSYVHFGYKAGPVHNLASVKRTRSGDKLVNGLYVITKNPPSEQIDATSVDKYGFHEEQASLTEVTDNTVAAVYAAGELTYRSTPMHIYGLVPQLAQSGSAVPRPLEDYHVGTIFTFSAKRGSIDVENQRARIFSLSLSIDNRGQERVTGLNTTVSG